MSDIGDSQIFYHHTLTSPFWTFIPTDLVYIETAHTTAFVSKPREPQDEQKCNRLFLFKQSNG